MSSKLIKLKAEDITIGQRLTWPICDSNGSFLVREGFVIKSSEQVEHLISRGVYGQQADLDFENRSPLVVPKPVEPDDHSSFTVLEDVTSQLAITLASGENNNLNFPKEIMVLVAIIQHECDRNPHAALASLFVLEGGSYPIKHSVDVAILCEVMAHDRLVLREQRKSVIAAALTMNISMIKLQEKLYRQEAPLTAEQKKTIQSHPQKSVEILRRVNVEDKLWLQCVMAHHEVNNGTGYPKQMFGKQYPQVTQLITLADQYCARLSPRSYRNPALHMGILRDILLDKGKMVESDIQELLIKELGFYPPGLLVKLKNSEIGVVTARGDKVGTPIVYACKNTSIGNYEHPIRRNTALDRYKIISVLLSNDPEITFDKRIAWEFDKSEYATEILSMSSSLDDKHDQVLPELHTAVDAPEILGISSSSDNKRGLVFSEIHKAIDELPVLPAAICKLMGLSISNEHYFKYVQQLAEQDPTFAVRLIRQANSASQGLISEISTLKSAVARIGSLHIKMLFIASSVAQIFIPTNNSERNLWVHSIQVAITAQTIARLAPENNIDPEQAYLCGLLHDIGRFILFMKIPEGPVWTDEQDWGSPAELLLAEQAACGLNHAELGSMASKRWALPEDVSTVINNHHNYTYSTLTVVDQKMTNLIKIVQMADYFSVQIMRDPEILNLPPQELEAKILETCRHSSWDRPPVSPALLQKEAFKIYEQASEALEELGIHID